LLGAFFAARGFSRTPAMNLRAAALAASTLFSLSETAGAFAFVFD